MSFHESERVSEVRAISRRGTVGKPASEMTITLSAGDPDFATPQPIVDAMVQALAEGHTHYVPAMGLPELRDRIAAHASAESRSTIDRSQVMLTHGGSAGITSTVLACVNPGQTVVVPDPAYSLYADAVALAGGRLITVPAEPGREGESIRRLGEVANEEGAVLLIICNPINPTGGVYTAEALESLAEMLTGTECLMLSDEAYKDIRYSEDFTSALEIEQLRSRLIYCQTFSKTFAMTGWRLGYLIAEAPIISAASLVHRTMTGPLNAATQKAAMTALEVQGDVVPEMVATYRNRRQLVLDALEGVPGVSVITPVATFYVFLKYNMDIPSEELRVLLEERYGVAVRAGSEYGAYGEGHIRLSFAYSEETLRYGLNALTQAFTDLDRDHSIRSK